MTAKESHKTFGTAEDLPTIKKLRAEVRRFKILKFFMRAEQRTELKQLENQITQTVSTVDKFYALLGSRNWIFHDDMNLPALQKIVSAKSAEKAEERLIEYYQDAESLKFLVLRLHKLPAIRPRLELVQKASEDYLNGRYYACVLTLIAVMDGTVNDVDKAIRKGLHARKTNEMVAWDSVTDHHLGLKHAHRSFTKTFYKTVTEEVTELYRHGIVHGMIPNFDNIVVATKALNRLFAIVDWAINREKRSIQQPLSTLTEVLKAAAKTQRANRMIAAFLPADTAVVDESDKNNHPVVNEARSFLEGWQKKNYMIVGSLFLRPASFSETSGQLAGQAKELYRDFELEEYSIKQVRQTAPLVSMVNVKLVVNSENKEVELRWIYANSAGNIATPGEPGHWKLAPYGPIKFLK